jgi:hypothetical protein
MTKVAIALAAAGYAALAGCGDDAAAPSDARPSGACAEISLDRLTLPGIYHGDLTLDGSEAATSFRIDASAAGPVVALGGGLAQGVSSVPVAVSPVGIVATMGDDSDGRTLSLTSLDRDCTLRGTWRRCVNHKCYVYELEARRADHLDEPVAHGLTELGEWNGAPGDEWTRAGLAVNVRVDDGVAYLATYQDGLRIVDVHDPAHLVELGHLAPLYPDRGEIYNDVKVVDVAGATPRRYALLASNFRGVVVIDVTTPTAPVPVATFGTAAPAAPSSNVHSIFVDGGKAYLANIEVGLEIWDLADPAHATRLGLWAHPDVAGADVFPHDLYVAGARAYVDYWGAGMSIVDVSTPSAPRLVGEFAGYGQHTSHSSWVTQIGARTIAVHGDEQWGAHLHVVDVTEGSPAFATSIGEWQTRPEVSIHNVMAFGSRAYVAYYQDGVRVLDLSDPAHPTPIAWFDTWPGYPDAEGTSFFEAAVGIDVDLDRQLVYVADASRGLIVLHLDV